jgi:hypothetical protein
MSAEWRKTAGVLSSFPKERYLSNPADSYCIGLVSDIFN